MNAVIRPDPGTNRVRTCCAIVWSTTSRRNGSSSGTARSAYPGAGSSSAIRTAAARSSLTSLGSSSLARSRAGYGPERGRGDEHAAVGEASSGGDAEVLAPRRGHERSRPAQQRPEVRRAERSGDLDPVRGADRVGPGDDQRLVAPARPRPGLEHEVQPPLDRVPGIRDRGDVAGPAPPARAVDRRRRQHDVGVLASQRIERPLAPSRARAAHSSAGGARPRAARSRGGRAGSRRRSSRARSPPAAATEAPP